MIIGVDADASREVKRMMIFGEEEKMKGRGEDQI